MTDEVTKAPKSMVRRMQEWGETLVGLVFLLAAVHLVILVGRPILEELLPKKHEAPSPRDVPAVKPTFVEGQVIYRGTRKARGAVSPRLVVWQYMPLLGLARPLPIDRDGHFAFTTEPAEGPAQIRVGLPDGIPALVSVRRNGGEWQTIEVNAAEGTLPGNAGGQEQ